MNTILRNVVGVFRTLFLAAPVQAVLDVSYTTLDVPGANNTEAYGIDGGNIVGTYYNNGGWHHGFLAIIPAPATLSLLTLGGLMILWRRR